ncbi:hypothetical protein C7S20_12825 [Christiangramia fulva]|uniref:Uncharacterized protein n=1 Tax=Christiangramia fulva TaxID=2126553 RepID=A0A2R3Z707_9FLAO|nr:hypothetical protein [Christiangramia fulva]AVR46067.1 hypothetical protein C7S20_12825 [Christiangramia fulva]
MAKLIVYRNSEWANKNLSYSLYLNDKKLSEIKDQQEKSFSLPEGDYCLKAKMRWCGSQSLDFKLEKTEEKRIEVTGFVFSEYFFPAAIGCVLLFLGYRVIYQKSSLFLATLMMVFFGYLLYFVSIGRKHFLQLKELN